MIRTAADGGLVVAAVTLRGLAAQLRLPPLEVELSLCEFDWRGRLAATVEGMRGVVAALFCISIVCHDRTQLPLMLIALLSLTVSFLDIEYLPLLIFTHLLILIETSSVRESLRSSA